MTQDQFDRESNFRLAFSIFRQLYASGLLTAEQFTSAREKLVERFNPPIAVLSDMLEPHASAPSRRQPSNALPDVLVSPV